jgi:uncharacterized protein (DUF2141 family)
LKFLFLLCFMLLACAPTKQNELTVSLEVNNPKVGKVPVVLFLEYQNKPLTKALVMVRGDMTHAGMSPVQALAREMGTGRYALDNFGFTMSGDWVLSITAKKGTQTLSGEAKLGVNP